MDELTVLQKIAVWALPLIFSITVHEAAHAWVANLYGDTTAKMLGRLTFNPIKHIDPVGTLLLPGLMMFFTSFIFGWAKPVPVNENNLRNPRRDMVLVALAGPCSNLCMAIIWAGVLYLGQWLASSQPDIGVPLMYMGSAGIYINIILMLLNILPIPPLDGSKVLMGFLPPPMAYKFRAIEPYGFFILLFLLMSGTLWQVLSPPLTFFLQLFGVR